MWQRNEEKKRLESLYYSPDIDYYLYRPDQSIRNAPLALAHPIDIDQITEIKLPEHWPVEPTTLTVDHAAFSLNHTITTEENIVTMRDHYVSKADHVDASETEDYVKHLEKARNVLGYALYQNDSVPATEETQEKRAAPSFVDKINWPIFLLATIQIIFFFSLAKKWYLHDRPVSNIEELPKKSIGGWLLLPMLGIVLTPFRNLIDFADLQAYGVNYWATVMSFGHANYHALRAPLLLFELCGNLASIIFSSLLLILFFQRRSSVPVAYTAIFSGILLYHWADLLLAQFIPHVGATISDQDWIRLSVGSFTILMWSIYFFKSERAKATFIETRSGRKIMGESQTV
jgi:hypothetical protein